MLHLLKQVASRYLTRKPSAKADGLVQKHGLPFAINLEVIAIAIRLLLYVRLDYFIRHIPAATAKIPSRPKMTTPILTTQRFKFMEQSVRTLTLQPLDQSADRQLRRDGHKQVDVILGDMPFQNLNRLIPANFPEHFPRPIRYISHQNRLPILGYPHQMQMDDKNTMGTMPIFAHASDFTQEMLKLPAKAGGFDPPKGRQ
jgi:hypothetical protein